jgi:hypothetical protein
VLLAATLAHGTVQAAPTLLQDHLCHLEQKPGRAFFSTIFFLGGGIWLVQGYL